ncbi:hypothetical protein GCM10007423_11940 [Dyadobacter endophyticus]|uniref:Uncharacterized protein n=1 Tax=Dyadobacter endophyticus TaxID=1749036 RepID=A0ABQ1YIH3_9BACT|nr:hypothetical protein [Dyadobacter endophyticus]GGH26726.1 hypothetical protein GCM10007423_11940 [Dyadobacter endophyticus]
MKKVRFFSSVFLEALDQRIISILDSHKIAAKQTSFELRNHQLRLDKKINEELNFLTANKDSAIIEYKLKQVYAVEKDIARRSAFIARKSELTTAISIFEEIMIEMRNILVNELDLLGQQALKITPPHRLHNIILSEISIYSKSLNSSWAQIREAIEITPNLNQSVDKLTDETREKVKSIRSIETVKLKNENEILALVDCNYHQEVIRSIEVYFLEMNNNLNNAIKKKADK